jgi:hypothetical protein
MNPIRFYFPLITSALFTFFCAWVALQAMQSASATVNAYQERQAEAFCQADPSYCGRR